MKFVLILITLILGVIGVISEPIKKKQKVKTIGWVIITLLSCAAIIGGIQEKRSQDSSRKAAAQIDSLKVSLKLTSENLISAEENLSRQMDINLITILSNKMSVNNASIWLNFTGEANNAKSITSYLFSKKFDEMREVIYGKLIFHPFLGSNSTICFDYQSDSTLKYLDFLYRPLKIKPEFVFPSFLDPNSDPAHEGEPISLIDTSRFIFSDSSIESAQKNSAIAFRDISNKTRPVAEISIELKKFYKDEEEIYKVMRKYNLKVSNSRQEFSANTPSRTYVKFYIEPELKKQFVDYWGKSLVSANVYLYLQNDAYLMFECPLTMKIDSSKRESIKVLFYPYKEANLKVGIEEF